MENNNFDAYGYYKSEEHKMEFGNEHTCDPSEFEEVVNFDTGKIDRVSVQHEGIKAGIDTAMRIHDTWRVMINVAEIEDHATQREVFGYVTAAILSEPSDSFYRIVETVKVALARNDETLDIAARLDPYYPKA